MVYLAESFSPGGDIMVDCNIAGILIQDISFDEEYTWQINLFHGGRYGESKGILDCDDCICHIFVVYGSVCHIGVG